MAITPEELRKLADAKWPSPYNMGWDAGSHHAMCRDGLRQAAMEIERLRMALQAIADQYCDMADHPNDIRWDWYLKAREALQQSEDK